MAGAKVTDPATRYAKAVLAGRILANRWVRLACERHVKDGPEGHDAPTRCNTRGLYFDRKAAAEVFRFFTKALVFYEGTFAGKPFLLQPWQQFIVGSLFGWKTADGSRRFRTAFIITGKGNGKSPLAAGVGLYGLTLDGESGAEILSAATTREQAGILFRDARAFAEGSDRLKAVLEIGEYNISYPATFSFFRPVSSEHRGLDGRRPHIALIDEVHEHADAMVVDKLRAGTKGRRQALILEISNAGFDRQSVCYQHHEYSTKVLEGLVENDSWFAYITGLDVCAACAKAGKTQPQDGCPDCDDWRDERVWPKANPNVGVSIQPKYLREQVAEAVEIPSKRSLVQRLNFSMWTESLARWIPADAWAACGTPDVDPEALRGRTCYAGLDLSSTTDLTALALCFPPQEEGGRYELLLRFWLPQDNMHERVHRDRVPYDQWARQGYITLTGGTVVDYGHVLAQIKRDAEQFQIVELAFDRWGSAKIVADLQDLGFDSEAKGTAALVSFGQGFADMSGPTKELEKLALSGRLAHGDNPVLAWMVSNVAIQQDAAGNVKVAKNRSTERVDGVIASIMALGRALTHRPAATFVSVYESRGILIMSALFAFAFLVR